ncbi:zincin-like metallopeptidase domain-containing protein [Prevotella sp. E9-3]|uniref:zincin-like metallopeptidase domain-containing protein n=1 Tax=Prevotella sp. E9-3 TaxID=2913621 RepID=UPI001EDB66BF|nr:zincin-like metallopeptidase domain-containing protein [Prevotella sp. E9-3]UKK47549.1 zincin-like metallopeptidase domain-containing protein [Prevotella sp. E9-3]
MEDNKDNSVKETEQKPQERTEGKTGGKTMAEKAIDRFAQMMVTRLEEMKGQQWEKGWIDGGGRTQGLPQNLSGRRYSGHNDFFLQLHTAINGYDAPVYATYKQIRDAGATVNKGEKAMPVIYWNISHKDENGQKISDEAFDAMTKAEQAKVKTIPIMMGYYVWNLQQTNFAEVKPEQYAKLTGQFKAPHVADTKGMYESKEFDAMIDKQAWVCKIKNVEGAGASYSPSKDEITVPMKAQFKIHDTPEEVYKDGMEYYSSIAHEMAHSTGVEKRLGRDMEGHFGDPKYAKEELVAELTAAMVGNTMGFDKRILDNNAKYVDGWMDTLKKEPRFILSVMADVNKASKMILDHVDAQRLEMGMKTLQPKEEANNGKTTETKVASETKMDIAAEPIAKPMTKTEEKAELAKETAAVFKDLKEKHPDALLLMRKGDFYEAFDEDAKKVAKSTGLKEQHIIKEGFEPKEGKGDEKGISYVNFKNTSLDKYLPKLVRDGHRVAICDSLEDIAKQRISERKETQTKANELQQPTEQKAKTIPLEQFNKLETEDGKKIDHFAVFKMKSGNYGVRAMVDGQQMSVKALDKEDRNAFFEHTTTKAALVQKYYGKELSQPKQEQRSKARAV